MIEKKENSKMDIDQKDNESDEDDEFKLKPDKNGNFEHCEVVLDDVSGRHFDVMMSKVDVKKHFYGIANFYIIQVLYDKVKNIFILWTRWGRLGDVGQFQRTPFNEKSVVI